MASFLLIMQCILVVVITIAVLLQKSSSIGLGAYSGSNESLFGAKGPAGFLSKFTFIVGLVFIINTLALGYTYNKQKSGSLAEKVSTTSSTPTAPVAPVTDNIPSTPSAPVAPSTPLNQNISSE